MYRSIQSFLVGCFLSTFLIFVFASNVDRDFASAQSDIQNVIATCTVVNSTPKSFDTREVTCNNGAVMKITNKE